MQTARILDLPVVFGEEEDMSSHKKNLIARNIIAAAKENRLPCAAGHAIAKRLGVRSRDVGDVADELKVKISKCQLGCF